MIQIIGLLICAYVFIRGLDIWSRVEDRKSAKSVALAYVAAVLAILIALLFAWMLIADGASVPTPPSS